MSQPKYNIITINDERKAFKDKIRDNVRLEEFKVDTFNAYYLDPVEGCKIRNIKYDIDCWPNAKTGELGVWLSNYDNWLAVAELDSPLVVFEDDAIINETFRPKLDRLINELPDNWDCVALWVPEDQRIDYRYAVVYELGIPRINGVLPPHVTSLFDYGAEHTAFVYQGYGMVSLMYSPNGAKKLVELTRRYGITGPVDCWIYEHAHMGNLNGYAPKPDYADIVTYDWSAISHVQLSERAL